MQKARGRSLFDSISVGGGVRLKKLVKGVGTLIGTTSTSVAAYGLWILDGDVAEGEMFEVQGRTYTFKAVLTAADDIKLGAGNASWTNLMHAINHTGTPGTHYHAATTINPLVTASLDAPDTIRMTAKQRGVVGNNSISVNENIANVEPEHLDAGLLTGGSDPGSGDSSKLGLQYSVPGMEPGDIVILNFVNPLAENLMLGETVVGTDMFTIHLADPSGAPVEDLAAGEVEYLWFDVT